MAASVFERVESLLNQHGIAFQVTRHEPVYTSEEAARLRGTPLASGAKALVVKGEEGFVMFVVPADRKLDSHAIRRAKGWKKMRFATREEVVELTGLTPGSIPGKVFPPDPRSGAAPCPEVTEQVMDFLRGGGIIDSEKQFSDNLTTGLHVGWEVANE